MVASVTVPQNEARGRSSVPTAKTGSFAALVTLPPHTVLPLAAPVEYSINRASHLNLRAPVTTALPLSCSRALNHPVTEPPSFPTVRSVHEVQLQPNGHRSSSASERLARQARTHRHRAAFWVQYVPKSSKPKGTSAGQPSTTHLQHDILPFPAAFTCDYCSSRWLIAHSQTLLWCCHSEAFDSRLAPSITVSLSNT